MKWLKRIGLGLASLILLAVLVIYAWGGMIISKTYDASPRNIFISSRPEIVGRGERLAQVFGCYHGCHGKDMEGQIFEESWAIGRIVSPNLTLAMDKYSRSELEAIIRQGVKPDGTSVMLMPSASFSSMTDTDLSAILSFIESYPRQEQNLGYSTYGPLARLGLMAGKFKSPASEVNEEPWQSRDLQAPGKHGEYLAMNVCSECHGLDLNGFAPFTPSLDIVKGYSLEDFKKLMKTGTAIGERKVGLMSEVARTRFEKMTVEEVEALHEFLVSR